MRKVQLVVSVLVLVLFLVSCAPKAAPAPQPPAASTPATPAPGPAKPTPGAPSKPAWEAKWEETLTAAKQERDLVIYTAATPKEIRVIAQALKENYQIAAEGIVGRGSAFVPRWLAERRAGLYLNDIYIGGYNTALIQVKPTGTMDSMDSTLILPDVTDPARIKQVWYQGQFPWVDKEHTVFITSLQPRPTLAINTSLVKEGEIKSYRDLLDPKWKGKIIEEDPTTSGGGRQVFQALMVIMGKDFLRELAKQQPVFSRDERQALDWLAMGKYPVQLGPNGEQLVDYIKLGAPVKEITPVEGVYASAATSGIFLFNRAPHPNVAKVFINWITSKEGQELYAPAGNYHSLRLDVSTAHLLPHQMRQPGVKLYDASGESETVVRNTEAANFAKELYGAR